MHGFALFIHVTIFGIFHYVHFLNNIYLYGIQKTNTSPYG